MRILHFITRLILGGAQENTVLTCAGQVEGGHAVTLAYGPIYGPEGSHRDHAAQTGARLVELPDMIRAVHPWRDLKCYRQCKDLIREFRPDVVHTHAAKAGVIGRAAAWSMRVPLIVHTIHGLPFHAHQSRLTRAVYVAAERWCAKRCHRIVSVAESMTDQALAARIGRPEQFQTIYSGMELGPYLDADDDRCATRESFRLTDNHIVIGTVARLAELKGHDDLLDALGRSMQRDPRLRLLWVGDGWWRERLTRRAQKMGLADRIIMTGLVPPTDVPRLMRAMDVLVHPSYHEGLPRTLPQALLSNVPIVAYDTDGAPEVCRDGDTGRLVATGDRRALGKAVAWMADHPDQRRAMAERGRAWCRERFDHHEMVRQLEALYQSP